MNDEISGHLLTVASFPPENLNYGHCKRVIRFYRRVAVSIKTKHEPKTHPLILIGQFHWG